MMQNGLAFGAKGLPSEAEEFAVLVQLINLYKTWERPALKGRSYYYLYNPDEEAFTCDIIPIHSNKTK